MVRQAHRRAVEAPVSSVVGFAQDLLSRRVTAYIVGVKDAKTITRWANGEVAGIRDHNQERCLRAIYEIGQTLLELESERTVRAWFVSSNPYLDDLSPVEALHAGNTADVKAAAHAFIANG